MLRWITYWTSVPEELSVRTCDFVVTKKLGTNFTEASTCPEWTKFLNQIFAEDEELIKFMQRVVGYSLTGYVSEQRLFILIGTGANGKSTFLKVLQSLTGDYAGDHPNAKPDGPEGMDRKLTIWLIESVSGLLLRQKENEATELPKAKSR